jgi:hypothetical protein
LTNNKLEKIASDFVVHLHLVFDLRTPPMPLHQELMYVHQLLHLLLFFYKKIASSVASPSLNFSLPGGLVLSGGEEAAGLVLNPDGPDC